MVARRRRAARRAARRRRRGGQRPADADCRPTCSACRCCVHAPAETTALGAACLAALGVGLWSGREEVAAQWRLERRFDPRISDVQRAARLARWHAAIDVARRWQA
jgi:glycerol kinase